MSNDSRRPMILSLAWMQGVLLTFVIRFDILDYLALRVYEDLLAPGDSPGSDGWGRLANFRFLDLIGQGGMGIVFRAEDTRLRRVVALKVMQPRFASETKIRQRL